MAKRRSDREILVLKAEAAIILRKRMARIDFWAFCLYMNPDFFSKRLVLKRVADAFQRVSDSYDGGIIYRLAVSLPPRAGKSYISSLFIAWMLGRHPEESVMRNTCSDPLYNKLSYDTRDIVKSRKFQDIFPDARLSSDKKAVAGWNLQQSKQVGYFGAGVGGTVIGFGASMLAMTDDLYKKLEDALSDNMNEKIWSWKQGTHDSRFEGNCCQIDIGTRWSETDVLGRMEAANKYDEIIRIPALNENDESFCPDVHTTEYYRDLRAETDQSIWAAEYMQEPIEAKGLLFPKSELMYFKRADLKGEPDGHIGACDVADKGDDDLSAPFGDIYGDKVFITDVVFTKDPVEVTEPRLAQMIIDTGCDKIRIESNNGGRIFAKDVRAIIKASKCPCEVLSHPTTTNKETRIIMKSGYIKKHFVFLSEGEYVKGSDYWRFMKGLTSYKREGDNAHDDAPDSATILAEFITALFNNQMNNVRRVSHGVLHR
jgi:predicted phage terminase large subunit-like protein